MPQKAARTYTAADIETLTSGRVDRKMAENWHNRNLWLTPSERPPRGKRRLYSLAHLFEALTRATLVESGFTHAAARTAIELRLAHAALNKERQRGRRGDANTPTYVLGDEVAQEIFNLPELTQRNADWYWAIYFGCHYEQKESEIQSTIAFKGSRPVSDLFTPERVASVVHISTIARDVLAYGERGDDPP